MDAWREPVVTGFLEHLIAHLQSAAERIFHSEQAALGTTFWHKLDPRAKVLGTAALIAASAAVRQLGVLAALFIFATLIALLARLPLASIVRIWLAPLTLTGIIAVPAIFLTPGDPLYGYATRQGLLSAAYLVLRVETASTFASTLVLTTPWTQVLKALRSLRVPVVVVVVLSMTVRYIVLLLDTARDMFESQRSRTVGSLDPQQQHRLIYNTSGVLLGKTMQLSTDVYLAMQARGFRGEVYLLDEFKLTVADATALTTLLAIAAAAIWIAR